MASGITTMEDAKDTIAPLHNFLAKSALAVRVITKERNYNVLELLCEYTARQSHVYFSASWRHFAVYRLAGVTTGSQG